MLCPKCGSDVGPETCGVGKKIAAIPGNRLIDHVMGLYEPPEPCGPSHECFECDYTAESDEQYEADLAASAEYPPTDEGES